MATLYLFRHGQASFGNANYDILSSKGVVQARVLAEHLLAAGVKADAVYTGEMKRQIDTAIPTLKLFEEFGNSIPSVFRDSSFNEYASQEMLLLFAGEVAGREELSSFEHILEEYKGRKRFQELFEKIVSGWATGKYTGKGVATWEEFTGRVWGGIEKIISDNPSGRTVFVFTSGGPISAVVQKALGLSNEAAVRLSWQIANASMTKFFYNKDRFTLSSFNETAHLALKKDEALITYR